MNRLEGNQSIRLPEYIHRHGKVWELVYGPYLSIREMGVVVLYGNRDGFIEVRLRDVAA